MNPTKLLENTSTTQVGSKPFRAYMVDNTSSSAGAKMFSIAIGDNITAIDSLNTIADDKAVYYDLQGNRLNAPQKGINIVKRGCFLKPSSMFLLSFVPSHRVMAIPKMPPWVQHHYGYTNCLPTD